jgi:hypothetical protein
VILIGRHIVKFEQSGQRRAEYAEQLIEPLSADLKRQFGRGFGRANFWQMRAFYRAWPEAKILQTLPGESTSHTTNPDSAKVLALASRFPLSWSAYVRLLSVKNAEAGTSYEIGALLSGWPIQRASALSARDHQPGPDENQNDAHDRGDHVVMVGRNAHVGVADVDAVMFGMRNWNEERKYPEHQHGYANQH